MKRIPVYFCMDCSQDTSITDEYYMVHDELWRQATTKRKGMLCIDCIEKRLGRRLQPQDFKDCKLTQNKWTKSPKLMSRYCSVE